MRNFSQDLTEHLALEATTTCTCWIIILRDGTRMGFTDHDNDLAIENIVCSAASGFQPTEAVSELGLSADNQEIEGAISSDAISETSLKAGEFDNARVQVWLVNWQNPEQRHHLRTAVLGEVGQEDNLFKAELRGITSLLDQLQGRSYSRTCDAVLGDEKCKVDLDTTGYSTSGSVVEVVNRRLLKVAMVQDFPVGWFAGGNLTWTGGDNIGQSVEIDGTATQSSEFLRLWMAMPTAPKPGDTFEVTAGCDKSFATCRSKFSNGLNFRGCPHMPGADFSLSYAKTGSVHDGSPLVT